MTREPRCAEWARSFAADPAGTAGSYTGYVLIEWPLPWPKDVGQIRELQPLVAALRGTGLRLQAVCAAEGRGERNRVVVYRQQSDDGWCRRADGVERLADWSTVVDEAIDLVATHDGETTKGTDVLICGHGRRDVCCGSRGVQLVSRVLGGGGLGRDVRIWRTTHLGGHRFAPTALVLPDATSWAFLDERSLAAVVHRTGDPKAVAGGYRGCSGLRSPAAQAVERAVLVELGWSVLDADRRAVHLEPGGLRFDVRGADGEIATWNATLVEGRNLPVPDCGERPDAATERSTELIVASLLRVAGRHGPAIEQSLIL
ncbi:MAG: sucrase ferredoxin [Acidimicrobiales bacterium]